MMPARWMSLFAAALIALATVALSQQLAAAEPGHLFCIRSTKNANVVCYDVRRKQDGSVDTARPLDLYWIMYAKAGQREEVSALERRFGYGTTLVGRASSAGFRFKMNVLPSRTIEVSRSGEGFRAQMTIAGRPAWITDMHAHVKKGILRPKVRYVMLRGEDVQTRRERVERIEEP